MLVINEQKEIPHRALEKTNKVLSPQSSAMIYSLKFLVHLFLLLISGVKTFSISLVFLSLMFIFYFKKQLRISSSSFLKLRGENRLVKPFMFLPLEIKSINLMKKYLQITDSWVFILKILVMIFLLPIYLLIYSGKC